MVESVERMLMLGVARLLEPERLDQLEESFEDVDSEKDAGEKKVEKPEKETEGTVRGSNEEMRGWRSLQGVGRRKVRRRRVTEVMWRWSRGFFL